MKDIKIIDKDGYLIIDIKKENIYHCKNISIFEDIGDIFIKIKDHKSAQNFNLSEYKRDRIMRTI